MLVYYKSDKDKLCVTKVSTDSHEEALDEMNQWLHINMVSYKKPVLALIQGGKQ
jgi:hypothetical protein